MKNNNAQKINCDVKDCKFNEVKDEECNLGAIKVCSCDAENDKEATMCDSYRKKK